MKPGVSIIVANYNNEQYLYECIKSILDQTYQDFEIIITDDCSTDNSRIIIDKFTKRYSGKIRSIYHNKNLGVALNRHLAIVEADREYITTLDSDDSYYENIKLEKEMNLIQKYRTEFNENIIAFSNIIKKYNSGRFKLVGCDNKIAQGYIFDNLITRRGMIPRDFIFLKEIYSDVGGYDFNLPLYEDWDLKIRIASKYKYYYTGVIGTAYRIHGMGLSSSSFKLHLRCMNYVFSKNKKLLSKKELKSVKISFSENIDTIRTKALKEFKYDWINNIRRKKILKNFKVIYELIKIENSLITLYRFLKFFKTI